jgi:hypothetical protein
MTDLTTTHRPTPTTPAVATREPALITEQQVHFSTAAAGAVAPAKTRRWTGALASVANAVRTYLDGPDDAAQRHCPKRHAYLEDALMAREMDRL